MTSLGSSTEAREAGALLKTTEERQIALSRQSSSIKACCAVSSTYRQVPIVRCFPMQNLRPDLASAAAASLPNWGAMTPPFGR